MPGFLTLPRASCFESVTSIIFLASLSDVSCPACARSPQYNSCIIEDKNSNGMVEALILWQSIINSPCEPLQLTICVQ